MTHKSGLLGESLSKHLLLSRCAVRLEALLGCMFTSGQSVLPPAALSYQNQQHIQRLLLYFSSISALKMSPTVLIIMLRSRRFWVSAM